MAGASQRYLRLESQFLHCHQPAHIIKRERDPSVRSITCPLMLKNSSFIYNINYARRFQQKFAYPLILSSSQVCPTHWGPVIQAKTKVAKFGWPLEGEIREVYGIVQRACRDVWTLKLTENISSLIVHNIFAKIWLDLKLFGGWTISSPGVTVSKVSLLSPKKSSGPNSVGEIYFSATPFFTFSQKCNRWP